MKTIKRISLLLLISVFAFTLTGCGTTEEKQKDVVATKTCTKQMDGYVNTYKWTATNDNITNVELTIVYDNSLFGVESLSSLTDEQKEQIKNNMLTNLGLADIDHTGLDINIDIQDQMTINLKADLDIADTSVLKRVGMDYKSETNRSFTTAISASENDGYTCN